MDESTLPHKQWNTLPEGFMGKSELYRMLEEATWKQGMIG